MNSLKLFFAVLLTTVLSFNSNAQMHDHSKMATTKTDTIRVQGNCDMCKTRIEKAANVDGVLKAEWNKDSKILTLVYDPSKVKNDDVQKKIALAGHDTEKYRADDKVYNSLPACCKYR